MMTEKPSAGDALPTAKVMTNSFINNAILSNNHIAKNSWVFNTFGGVEFFDLVKSTSLNSLVSQNVDAHCVELKVKDVL